MNRFLKQLAGATGFLKTTIVGGDHVPSVSVDLPTSFTVFQVTVGVTEVQLTGTSTPVKAGTILKADPANTGVIYVILHSGTTSTGFPLSAGDPLPVNFVNNLNAIYLIASVASQKLACIAGLP
jgi:hypothetical protein